MYQLASSPCGKANGRNIVTRNLIDWILTVLGPVDENGDFTDDQRIVAYMKEMPQFKKLVGKIAFKDVGLLHAGIRYEDLIKNRYADILAKLLDERHEVTFDEFGEGLIAAICDYKNFADFERLEEYPDNANRFDCGEYIAPSQHAKNLPADYKADLERCAENCYNELIEDDDWKDNPPDRQKWINGYVMLSEMLLDDVGYYGIDPLDVDDLYAFVCGEVGLTEDDGLHTFVDSPLFVDMDYTDIINNLDDLDYITTYFENVGEQLGTVTRSARDIFKEQDMICDLDGNVIEP